MPLTHKNGAEWQKRETGAGNLIRLVFIWPSKTTPCFIAIHPAVDTHVCDPVCLGMCVHVFPQMSVTIQAHVHLWA